jgi:hypothetical protein
VGNEKIGNTSEGRRGGNVCSSAKEENRTRSIKVHSTSNSKKKKWWPTRCQWPREKKKKKKKNDKLPVIQHRIPVRWPSQHGIIGSSSSSDGGRGGGKSTVLTTATAGRWMVLASPEKGATTKLQLLPVHLFAFVSFNVARHRHK